MARYPNWEEKSMRQKTRRYLFALGVTLAAVGRWTMLASAGLTDVSPRLDVFVTGLVLGTSSLPAHAAITNIGDLISRIGGATEEKKKV